MRNTKKITNPKILDQINHNFNKCCTEAVIICRYLLKSLNIVTIDIWLVKDDTRRKKLDAFIQGKTGSILFAAELY